MKPDFKGFHFSQCAMACTVCVGLLVCLRPVYWPNQTTTLLRMASREIGLHHFHEAELLARRVLEVSPKCPPALLLAAKAAKGQYRFRESLAYLQQVPDDGSLEGMEALFGCGERCFGLGRAADAESYLQRVISLNPEHWGAHKLLAFVLQAQGRSWETLPHILPVLRSGQFRADELLMIAMIERLFVDDKEWLRSCREENPTDLRISLAEARTAYMDNRPEETRHLLQQILVSSPDLIEAQARMGELLAVNGESEAFLAWHQKLAPNANDHSAIWFARGVWAKSQGNAPAAVRCFLEVIQRDPNNTAALLPLAQLLSGMRESTLAQRFADRAAVLAKLEYLFNELKAGPDYEMLHQTVDLLESVGRYWEAIGWCKVTLVVRPKMEWARQGVARLRTRVVRSHQLNEHSPIPEDLDLNRFPLPEWTNRRPASGGTASPDVVPCHVRFRDVASEVGVKFQYANGTTPVTGLEHMLQSTGGGIAVLDFDGDLWPDLYFAQSGVWPVSPGQPQRDVLFRNLGNGRFDEVTLPANLGDDRYSQGVTAGDFNNDGFPDLYVCNVGVNRFYENQGDGTFREITAQTGTECDKWSLSCAFADFNGDGLPDLYVVNYLQLTEVMKRECKHNGRPMGCAPTMFPAEQDRMYLNLGDGRFQDVTESSGIVAPDGKGLGLVIADFDESRRLSIFVGNDTTANFFFQNKTSVAGSLPNFVERALLSGLAFDEAGKAQSCMGIAVGDANEDGRLDLFVTNFYADSNTLYLQLPDQSFVDSTRDAQLRDPSFNMLGFGTQFLDGELDGLPDLVVTNGHVDRTFATGVPDVMPPQYFQNRGKGKFMEVSQVQLGPYFEAKCLGRSLVRLDWNRDGREDFCVSHLDVPAAILSNETPETGHFLTLHLRGVRAERDAIGTVVSVRAGDRRWVQQLTAGDGYMASNGRQLIFGLGAIELIDEIRIRWPSGSEQIFQKMPTNTELVAVEGRRELERLSRDHFP